MKRTIIAGTMMAVSLLWTVAAQAGGTPAAKCQAGKNKEAGKYAACREKAEAKLVGTAGTCSVTTTTVCYRDDECPGETCNKDDTKYNDAITKCETKFATKWTNLETKAAGACATTLDQSEIEGLVTDRMDRVAWELSGTARFVDNADGTITDRKTGLMWEKKVKLDSTTDYLNLQDADNYYRWAGTCSVSGAYCQPTAAASAACTAGVEGDATGCAECGGGGGTCSATDTIWTWLVALNTAGLGAHNDWKIPTREELVSIVDYGDTTSPVVDAAFDGASCGGACTDVADPACSCTRSGGYWSASTYAPNPTGARGVNFTSGGVGAFYYEDYDGDVRGVRSGS